MTFISRFFPPELPILKTMPEHVKAIQLNESMMRLHFENALQRNPRVNPRPGDK